MILERKIVEWFKSGAISVGDRYYLKDVYKSLDRAALEQICKDEKIEYSEVDKWIRQFVEQEDTAAQEKLQSLLDQLMYLPSSAYALDKFLEIYTELKMFLKDNSVALKKPRVMETLLLNIDRHIADMLYNVSKEVRKVQNRLTKTEIPIEPSGV